MGGLGIGGGLGSSMSGVVSIGCEGRNESVCESQTR